MERETLLKAARWRGRLHCVLFFMATNKDIDVLEIRTMTLAVLYMRVYAEASPKERQILDAIMGKFVEASKREGDNYLYDSQKEESKGVNETQKIYKKEHSFDKLVEDIDFYAISQARAKKRRLGIFIAVGAVILAVVIYNLPFFKEMRLFGELEDAYALNLREDYYSNKYACLSLCDKYFNEYPAGRHIEDVHMIKINLTMDMDDITAYTCDFPNGKYSERVNHVCDSLWDEEIAKYESRDKSATNPQAVAYMNELLQYMKKHRINHINLAINPDVNLKDFGDYDEGVKRVTEILYSTPGLTFSDDMVSITEEFTSADNETLSEILSEGLKESIDKIFTPGFISVSTEEDPLRGKTGMKSVPQVTFSYTIKNQEKKVGENYYPVIWTYSETSSSSLYAYQQRTEPKAFLIGISVSIEAKFSIPESDTCYEYISEGAPSENISGIADINDGYRRMTTISFGKFSNEMIDNLGLESIYFKGS